MPRDLALEVLKQIRDEVKKTNVRLDRTNERLDVSNERLDRLEHRQTESETRLATELVAVAGAVDRLRELLVTRLDIRDRVQDHETRIAVLEQKTAQ